VTQQIAFIDLAAQRRFIACEIDAAIARVLDHGIFISGPEVVAFEAKPPALCCALRGRLRQRHRRFAARPTRVIVPDFTFTATAEVVALVDGTPVFV
jgi:dTDP-4-amino-4,6-dideoxygalactose transaminase